MSERWRNIRRAPGYRVSSYGRVKSVDRTLNDGRRAGGGLLSTWIDKDGYTLTELAGESVRVTHLVLEAFDRPRPYGCEALHDPELSWGRSDNRLIVLRWGTHRENERDKKRSGRSESAAATRPKAVGTAETAGAAG